MRAPKGKRNAERRKEKSRDAARCRRSKETEIFSDLASELPLSSSAISHLDKASIIRVAISYLKIRAVLEAVPGVKRSDSNNKLKIEVYNEDGFSGGHGDSKINKKPSYVLFENDINSLFMNALAGFLLVVSSEGDVIFISENVQQHLGLSQVELLGQSIYELSHPCDHSEMKEILTSKENDDSVDQKNIFVRMKCTLSNKSRNLNLKSANYKVIQYTGHVIHDNRTYPLAKEELVKLEQLNDSDEDESDDGSGGGSRDPEELYGGSEAREKPSSPLSYFIAIGEPVPHPSDIQIPLGCSTFLSKHSLDMKFTYADEKINDFFGYNPESMMKKSVFDYHHAQDSLVIKQSFKNLFQKGQSQTQRYRFLALGGGYAWVLTQATLIYKDKSQKPHSVVCVNFVISGIEEEGCIYSLCQLGDRSGTGCLKSLSAETNPIPISSAKAAVNNVTAAGVAVSVEVPEREPKIVTLLDGKKRKKTADDCSSAINRSDISPLRTNRPESRYREPSSETLTTRLHDLVVSPKICSPFVRDKSPPLVSSVPLSATTAAAAAAAAAFTAAAPSSTASARDTESFPVPSVRSNVPKINLPAVTCLQLSTEKDDSGYCDTTADRSAAGQIYRSLNDNDSEAITFKKDVTSVADEVVRRIIELNGDDDTTDRSDSAVSSSGFCKLLSSVSSTFDDPSHIPNLLDRPKQTTPKPNTSNVFVPIDKDMNKGFLTFIDNDEDTGITTLKDEPEDLTHLAPTAGGVCVPLHATHENGGPLSYILPDMLEDIMYSDCHLLSPHRNDISDHELNSDHSPSPFFSYKDDLKESCSRPMSPRCEDDSNLPSLSSGDSPIYLRDSSINSLLDFGLVTSDDVKDLSLKASYEAALTLDQDTLLPLITNDLMWGSSSTDSSNWSSLSNSPRSNCSLSPQLDYDSTSSLAKLLKEDQLPCSYDNRTANVINHSKGGYINKSNNSAPSSFLNSTGRQPIHPHLRNEDKNEDIVHIRKRIRDDNNSTSNVSYNDNTNNRSATVRRNSITTQYTRNNNSTATMMNNSSNVVNLLKRRCTNYGARKGNVNNATNGLANNTVKLGDRKRSSNSALIGNKRAFNDTVANNSGNNNRSGINNGTGTGWKRSKQQQLNSTTNANRNGGEVGLSSPSSYNSNDISNHDTGGTGDGGGGGGSTGAAGNKLVAAAMKNCVSSDRYKQTNSVLMNLLVSGCDLNAGYDDNAANNNLLELNKGQQNVAPVFSCLSNSAADNLVVSRDAVQRARLKSDTVPARWSAVNLLETDSSRIPSLMELTEQDYAVNAPSAGELLQGSDLLKALENPSLIC